MPSIYLNSESLEKSPAIVGLRIARLLKKSGSGRISIFDAVDHFKDEPWFAANSFMYGLIFLYSIGAVDFDEPYLVECDAD